MFRIVYSKFLPSGLSNTGGSKESESMKRLILDEVKPNLKIESGLPIIWFYIYSKIPMNNGGNE